MEDLDLQSPETIGETRTRVPMAPAQAWFFEQGPVEPNHYNQSIAIRLREPVPLLRARELLDELATRHDAFRLRFDYIEGEWFQFIVEEPKLPTELHEVGAGEDPESSVANLIERLHRSLDIGHGPLARAALVSEQGSASLLLIVAHHLIVDAISWRVLLDDLEEIATAGGPGLAPSPPSAGSLVGWVQALAEDARGWSAERTFWSARPHYAALGPARIGRTGHKRMTLGIDVTRSLLATLPQADHGMDHLILAAISLGLCATFGTPGLSVDIESHGRTDLGLAADLSRSVGWFTAIWPLHIPVNHPSIAVLAGEVAQQFAAVPREGVGFGALRYLLDDPEIVAVPRSPVLFTYLGRTERSKSSSRAFDVVRVPDDHHSTRFENSPYLLTINAWIEDDDLTLDCYWNLAESATAQLNFALSSAVEYVRIHAEDGGVVVSRRHDRDPEPRTSTERVVLEAWTDVLGRLTTTGENGQTAIGVEDEFSELGGDSIHMIQIVSRIRRSLNVRVPLRAIGEYSTVRALATKIDSVAGGADSF